MWPRETRLLSNVLIIAWLEVLSGYGQQLGNRDCRFPNSLPGVNIDPARTVGIWFTWLMKATGPRYYNLHLVYTPLGIASGKLALSWYGSSITLGPQPTCMGMFAQHYLGTDGVKIGMTYISAPSIPPVPTVTVYSTLYTDYTGVEIQYSCLVPNNRTGICDSPVVMVNVRAHPLTISQSRQAELARTVQQAIGRYCGPDALDTVGWDASLPSCNPPALPTITNML